MKYEIAKAVWDALQEPLTVAELASKMNVGICQTRNYISDMVFRGEVQRLPGTYPGLFKGVKTREPQPDPPAKQKGDSLNVPEFVRGSLLGNFLYGPLKGENDEEA